MCSEAGLPHAVNCMTVNKVCASGLKATTIAASEVALGLADILVCGGMESMSRTPYYLPKLVSFGILKVSESRSHMFLLFSGVNNSEKC